MEGELLRQLKTVVDEVKPVMRLLNKFYERLDEEGMLSQADRDSYKCREFPLRITLQLLEKDVIPEAQKALGVIR